MKPIERRISVLERKTGITVGGLRQITVQFMRPGDPPICVASRIVAVGT